MTINRQAMSRWYDESKFKSGLWRAVVLRNDDPENMGRLQVRIILLQPESMRGGAQGDTLVSGSAAPEEGSPEEGSKSTTAEPADPKDAGIPPQHCPWAEPAFPWGGKTGSNSGFIALPEVGSTVWVAFEMGFTARPIWIGSWLGGGDMPTDFLSSDTRFLRTPAGHLMMFDDTDGQEKILIATPTAGANDVRFLLLDEAGATATLQCGADDVGGRIFMDETQVFVTQGDKALANRVTMTDAELKIEVGSPGVTIRVSSSGDVEITNAGDTTVTTTGDIIANCVNATIAAASDILLGGLATEGVCTDSLITIIQNMVTAFNAHTHQYNPGPNPPAATAAPGAAQVPPALGVNSSSTVKAKL